MTPTEAAIARKALAGGISCARVSRLIGMHVITVRSLAERENIPIRRGKLPPSAVNDWFVALEQAREQRAAAAGPDDTGRETGPPAPTAPGS